jgi:hypothetical protein
MPSNYIVEKLCLEMGGVLGGVGGFCVTLNII